MSNLDHPRKYHRKGSSAGRGSLRRLEVTLCSAQSTWRAGENGRMQEGERMGSHKEKELDLTSFPLQEWDVSQEASLRPRSPQGRQNLLQDWRWPGLRLWSWWRPQARWVSGMLLSLVSESLWGCQSKTTAHLCLCGHTPCPPGNLKEWGPGSLGTVSTCSLLT